MDASTAEREVRGVESQSVESGTAKASSFDCRVVIISARGLVWRGELCLGFATRVGVVVRR